MLEIWPDEKPELVAIASLPGVTPERIRELLTLFGSPRVALSSISRGEIPVPIEKERAALWKKIASSTNPENWLESLLKKGIETIVQGEKSYPELLSKIKEPPWVLFKKGQGIPYDVPSVAIVGSRKATSYGLEAARWLASNLSRSGVLIVSGAAYGVDSAAHSGAIESGGRTVAVLGCGPDIIYPSSNARLFQLIERNGCLISEYPPGTPVAKYNFPARNRIIAGMTIGVVVVEASEKSGALITANFAMEENREVMAVPGSIFSKNSKGTNELIASGAAPVSCAEDVLFEIGAEVLCVADDEVEIQDEIKSAILDALSSGVNDADGLSVITGISAEKVQASLVEMEVAGLVRRSYGGAYFPVH
ncbi:MAG: DNA-processing protein DprA [Actinomycetota bacterium]|nr:DNA-processing protein DprA [Actinomycetota bacterium]